MLLVELKAHKIKHYILVSAYLEKLMFNDICTVTCPWLNEISRKIVEHNTQSKLILGFSASDEG